jgi:hypothetical protein
MGNSLGGFDPDEVDNPTIMHNALLPKKNTLEPSALAACKRTAFKSTAERRRWKALADRASGGEERHIMYYEWMKHNIELAEKANAKATIPVRIFTNLMTAIENENRRVDWEAANKKNVMASRVEAVKSRFGKMD